MIRRCLTTGAKMSNFSFPKVKRVYRRYTEWECIAAGMYDSAACTQTDRHVFMREYASFLADNDRFQAGIDEVFESWPVSCENFLTDNQINRIAWLGQASACIAVGLPCCFCGGFWLLTYSQQHEANSLAHVNIRRWINEYNRNRIESEKVHSDVARQMLFGWDTGGSPTGGVEEKPCSVV